MHEIKENVLWFWKRILKSETDAGIGMWDWIDRYVVLFSGEVL